MDIADLTPQTLVIGGVVLLLAVYFLFGSRPSNAPPNACT